MVTGAEARAPALNVYVSPNPEVVQGVGEEYPFILPCNLLDHTDLSNDQQWPTHLDFEYSARESRVVLVVPSPKQVSHPEMFDEVRNGFGGELKLNEFNFFANIRCQTRKLCNCIYKHIYIYMILDIQSNWLTRLNICHKWGFHLFDRSWLFLLSDIITYFIL